jgi:hypothetical protein
MSAVGGQSGDAVAALVRRISGINRFRSDLFGMIHVCYAPVTTKFRIARVFWSVQTACLDT